MKKLPVYICCLSIFFLSFGVSAQDWQPFASNIGGAFASDLIEFQGDLYLGGNLTSIDTIQTKGLARWDGKNWIQVGKGLNHIPSFPIPHSLVTDMAVFDGELFIAGAFDSVDNISATNIARFDGTNWKAIGNSLGANDVVYYLEVFENELYACGLFDSIGGVYAPGIAKWDGMDWSRLGMEYFSNAQIPMLYKDKIYITVGSRDSISGTLVEGFARWDQTSWDQIVPIPSMAVFGSLGTSHGRLIFENKLLYAAFGELFQGGNSRFSVVQWDGNNWSVFDDNLKGDVGAMTNFKNELYVGYDEFNFPDPVVQKWENNNWVDVGSLLNGRIHDFLEYKGDHYLCGEFPGGLVYRYGFPTPIDQGKSQFDLSFFPNPIKDQLSFSYTLHQTQALQLTLYDLTGKKVASKNYGPQSSGSGQETLSIQNLAPGMYMAEVKMGEEIVTEKIVKR